jgi:hypothetical protein
MRMSAPLCGIAYGLSGIAGLLWGLRKRKSLQAVSVVILLVGAIDTYSEEWVVLKRSDLAFPLLVGFLWAYTTLSMGLMKQAGITKARAAFTHSFLPVVYALAGGFAFFLPDIMKTDENPPLTLYVYLLLILAIHIPAFAFGRGRAIQSGVGASPTVHGSNLQIYSTYLWRPLLVLGVPLFACFSIHAVNRGDWRLFWSNLALTIVLGSLFVITGPDVGTLRTAMSRTD